MSCTSLPVAACVVCRGSASRRPSRRDCGTRTVTVVPVPRVLATFCLLLACAELLFWPAMEECGIDTRGLGELQGLGAGVGRWLAGAGGAWAGLLTPAGSL